MATSFSTTVSNWQGIDDEPTAGSENLVKSGGVAELIDKTHLVNPTEKSLAKAEDAMQLKIKLVGIDADDTKIELDGHVIDGYYVSGVDGTLVENSNYKSFEISITSNTRKIRFLGATRRNTVYRMGYSFGNYVDGNYVNSLSRKYIVSTSPSEEEIIVKIPNDVTIFRCTCSTPSNVSTVNIDNFYCYLESGNSVQDKFDNIKELPMYSEYVNDFRILDGVISTNSEVGYYRRYTSENHKMAYINILEGFSKIKITTNSDYGTTLGFVKSGGHDYSTSTNPSDIIPGSIVTLSEGTSLYILEPSKTYYYDIPSDAVRLYFKLGDSAGEYPNRNPYELEFLNSLEDTIDKINEDISTANNKLNNAGDLPLTGEVFTTFAPPKDGNIVRSNSSDSGYFRRYHRQNYSNSKMIYIAVDESCKRVEIITNSNYGTTLGFVKSGGANYNSYPTPASIVYLSEGTNLITLAADSTYNYDIPSDTTKIYLKLGDDTAQYPDRNPISVTIFFSLGGTLSKMNNLIDGTYSEIEKISNQIDLNLLYNIPLRNNGWNQIETIQQKVVKEKSDRFTSCKWTPVTSNMCWSTRNDDVISYYQGGVEYSGLPYSSNVDHAKWIGTHVSLYTFLTAVQNKYSLLYTECVKTGYSVSAWGYQYTMSRNGSTYYGLVCCAFTAYTTNSNVVWNNGQFWGRTDAFDLIQLHSQTGHEFNLDLLKVGDVLDNSEHSFLIYDILVENNHVTKIKATQATSGVDTINHVANGAVYRNSSDGYIPSGDVSQFDHFRPKFLGSNYKFKPFDINVYNSEGEVNIQYNYDICPIGGNKCTFANNQVVALNYNLTDDENFPYTTIMVQKDNDTPVPYSINEIVNSELHESQQNHALRLDNLLSGKYEAWCTDGTNDSEHCQFIVVSPDDFSISIDSAGVSINLLATDKLITFVSINDALILIDEHKINYTVSGAGVIQPQSVRIPAREIPNFDTNNISISFIDIMTEYGIQRLRNIALA